MRGQRSVDIEQGHTYIHTYTPFSSTALICFGGKHCVGERLFMKLRVQIVFRYCYVLTLRASSCTGVRPAVLPNRGSAPNLIRCDII